MPLSCPSRVQVLVIAPILVVGLIVVPVEALNVVRWVAIVAALGWLVLALLTKENTVPDADGVEGQTEPMRMRSPSTGAALVVGVDGLGALGEDPAYISQVRNAIGKAVRAGDEVEAIGNGRFTVFLHEASPNYAEAIGLRICESVEDLILFEDGNRLKLISASVGGVVHANEDSKAGLATALQNLDTVQLVPSDRLLISVVA
ncbi:MAG TPA: hypothetical protein VL147_14565 [Devosia sp.]|nr:hypothetical protein [Devosia sp.]